MASYSYFKEDIRDYIKRRHGLNEKILDVGAGDGKWRDLLSEYVMDGVEVFEPNIERYGLKDKYREVFNVDIKDFQYKWYDVVIFGDVLEHLEVEEAQRVLRYAIEHSREVIVAVPYKYKQGIEYGNVYEIHKQDDLTPEIMGERYPEIKLLIGNDIYGYYSNNPLL